jgi:L-glyceraldehyde 3-phosphate reductase
MLQALVGLNAIAGKRGQTLAEMALAWCLKDQRVTSVIVGASRISQIEDNLKAMQNTSFTEEELREIDEAVKDVR